MNPREKRLLKSLVKNTRVLVKDLRSEIGALNPAQNASNLRNQGWVIETGYMDFIDRDGKKCRPGFYWMKDNEKQRAKEFLKKIEGAVAPTPSKKDDSTQKLKSLLNLLKMNITKLEIKERNK